MEELIPLSHSEASLRGDGSFAAGRPLFAAPD